MGSGSSASIKNSSHFEEYNRIKTEVFDSQEYKTIKFYFQELWPTAKKVIEFSRQYDTIIKRVDDLAKAIQLFGLLNSMRAAAVALSIIPQFFKPSIYKARYTIFGALNSALQFSKKSWDLHQDLYQLFKLLKGMEKKKLVLDKYNQYKHACFLLRCLKEKLQNHIQVNEVSEEVMEKFQSLKSVVKTISKFNSIAKPICKLNNFLSAKLFGLNVMFWVQSQATGLKGLIIRIILKLLILPLKKVLKRYNKTRQNFEIFEFPINMHVPQSGWLGLHYSYNFKKKKLDLRNSIPKQWLVDNVQEEKELAQDNLVSVRQVNQTSRQQALEKKKQRQLIFDNDFSSQRIEQMIKNGKNCIENNRAYDVSEEALLQIQKYLNKNGELKETAKQEEGQDNNENNIGNAAQSFHEIQQLPDINETQRRDENQEQQNDEEREYQNGVANTTSDQRALNAIQEPQT